MSHLGKSGLFLGVHEVRLLRPSGVAVGYFDSWDAALRTVENEPSQYKAAYFSLNPLRLPEGFQAPINPASLTLTGNTAGDADIERRVRLLVDLDPVRPAGTNSTAAEKQAASEQAEQVREYLRSRRWPEPILCDSGNGWHLLYSLDLPNDAASTELVRNVLARLKQLFPLVDATNFNASRVCKLYGSIARKGEPTDERPWRRSAIVEAPTPVPISREQMDSLSGECDARKSEGRGLVVEDRTGLDILLGFLDHYGIATKTDPEPVKGGWRIGVECPWSHEHSSGDSDRETAVSFIGKFGFNCFHSHCDRRNWDVLRAEMEHRHADKPPFFGSLPLITHATLAEDFLKRNDDFRAVYDAPGRPIAQWVRTRWDVSDDDTVLMRDVQKYLKTMHAIYPAPAKGPDSRLRLFDAGFITGTVRLVRPNLKPVRQEVFDQNPDLLALPNGRVVDLSTSGIREMRRDDYLTQRVYTAPDASCAIRRWDRFTDEITEGDTGLNQYLLRLGALCLTGRPEQKLFLLWGNGRSGKGVFIRVLCDILGDGRFAWPLSPEQITVSKFEANDAKRTYSDLKGRRLVTVNESVKGNLNFSMLKLLSGGDTINGRGMRQDAVAFKPTHKLVLPTNDKPILPADPAFKGRVHMVPFNANFLGREDPQLQTKLRNELPGILHQLITMCPGVLTNGLRPPASVIGETANLFEELDVTKQFAEDCLEFDPEGYTHTKDMENAAVEWLHGSSGVVVGSDSPDKILAELKRYPGVKYGRRRVDGEHREGKGRGQAFVYSGVRVKEPS